MSEANDKMINEVSNGVPNEVTNKSNEVTTKSNEVSNGVSNEVTTKSNEVIIKMLNNGTTKPKYAHPGDAAMDIVATKVEYDVNTDTFIYHTGLYLESKKGVAVMILPRSNMTNKPSYLPNSIGLIDTATYRGEILIKYKNRTATSIIKDDVALVRWASLPWYKKLFMKYDNIRDEVEEQLNWELLAPYHEGDKIAQMIVVTLPNVNIKLSKKLSTTNRGDGGFGSTGI